MRKELVVVALVVLFLFVLGLVGENNLGFASKQQVVTSQKLLPAYDQNKCYDSDNGINLTVRGITRGPSSNGFVSKTDSCVSNTSLVEYYCGRNKVMNVTKACNSLGSNYFCSINESKCIPQNTDGIYFVKAGDVINLSNGIRLNITWVSEDLVHKGEGVSFIPFIGNDKLSIYEKTIYYYEVFGDSTTNYLDYDLNISVQKTQNYSDGLIKIKIIPLSNKIYSTCSDIYNSCKNIHGDSLICRRLCPDIPLSGFKINNEGKFSLIYPQNKEPAANYLLSQFKLCQPLVQSTLNYSVYGTEKIYLRYGYTGNDNQPMVTSEFGLNIPLTDYFDNKTSPNYCEQGRFVHELSHYYRVCLRQGVFEEGLAVYTSQNVHVYDNGITPKDSNYNPNTQNSWAFDYSNRLLNCTLDGWKFIGQNDMIEEQACYFKIVTSPGAPFIYLNPGQNGIGGATSNNNIYFTTSLSRCNKDELTCSFSIINASNWDVFEYNISLKENQLYQNNGVNFSFNFSSDQNVLNIFFEPRNHATYDYYNHVCNMTSNGEKRYASFKNLVNQNNYGEYYLHGACFFLLLEQNYPGLVSDLGQKRILAADAGKDYGLIDFFKEKGILEDPELNQILTALDISSDMLKGNNKPLKYCWYVGDRWFSGS